MDIRVAKPEEYPSLCKMLAKAFYDQMRYMFPLDKMTHDTGLSRLSSMFKATMSTNTNIIHCTADLKACAIWTPPGTKPGPSGCGMCGMMCSILPLMGLCNIGTFCRGCRTMGTAVDMQAALSQIHPDPDENPHWYLGILGVDPDSHGKGYGTHLMEHMFELIERNVTTSELHPSNIVSVYLEAATRANYKFYLRRGYKLHAAISISGNRALPADFAIDPEVDVGDPIAYGMWYGPNQPELNVKTATDNIE